MLAENVKAIQESLDKNAADNEHSSSSLLQIDGQNHNRVIEAAVIDIWTYDNVLIRLVFLG